METTNNNYYINQLQSLKSYEEYSKEYLDKSLNALANMGQRFGIEANGLRYYKIRLKDILEYNNEVVDDSNKFASISLLDNNNGIKITYGEKSQQYIFTNNISFESKDLSENIINYFSYIDDIHDDSFILCDNNILTIFIKGHLKQNELDNDAEILYVQYDTRNNVIKHLFMTKYYGVLDNYDDWYIVYKIDYDGINSDKTHKYKNEIFIYRLFAIKEIIKNIIESDQIIIDNNIMNIDNYLQMFYNFNSQISIKNLPFTFFRESFSNFDNFKILDISNNYDSISFLNYVLTYDELNYNEKNIIKFSDIEMIYDGEFLYSDKNEVNSKLLAYIDKFELNNYLNSLKVISNQIYEEILVRYNSIIFGKTSNIFIYAIYKLYENISKRLNQQGNILYIPFEYNFYSIVNNENIFQIYHINDIYVSFINTFNKLLPDNKIYLYNKSNILHTSIYNINVDYNIKYDNIINSINVDKYYTLPYINKLNNWVIDDIDTIYQSLENKYNGIKQIFIYCEKHENNIETKILNISDNSIISNFTFENKLFLINNEYFSKFINIDVYCETKIPQVNDSNRSFFENTLIININSKNNISNSNYINDYGLDYIYSMWKFNGKEFEIITLGDNNFAFDPYNNLEIQQYKNNLYKHINILLAPQTKTIDSLSNSNFVDNYYITTRNKKAQEYHSNYNNNYNLITEYVDNIKLNGENPNYPSVKFIENIKNIKLTSTIYPQYITTIENINVTNIEEKLLQYTKDSYKTYINIVLDDNDSTITYEITNKKNLIKVYNTIQTYIENTNSIEIGIIKINQNYNENVFNDNIPTIDNKEIFIRNNNILNRTNILSPYSKDDQTIICNGYFGSSISDEEKNTLHISTSETNINIGFDTLLNSSQFNKFTKYDTLSIDGFNNIELNANDVINIYSPIVSISDSTYSYSLIPRGYMNKDIYFFVQRQVDTFGITLSSLNNNIEQLFIPMFMIYHENSNKTKYQYLYNTINLNLLVQRIFKKDINDYEIKLKSSQKMIIVDASNKLKCLCINDNFLSLSPKNSITDYNDIISKYNNNKNNNETYSQYIYNYKLNLSLDDVNKFIYINFDNYASDIINTNNTISSIKNSNNNNIDPNVEYFLEDIFDKSILIATNLQQTTNISN